MTVCFSRCLGLGWIGFHGSGLGFRFSFFVFSPSSRPGPRDLIGYGSHTVFVVTWQISTRSYFGHAPLCSAMYQRCIAFQSTSVQKFTLPRSSRTTRTLDLTCFYSKNATIVIHRTKQGRTTRDCHQPLKCHAQSSSHRSRRSDPTSSRHQTNMETPPRLPLRHRLDEL